jgi:hypothetical protein
MADLERFWRKTPILPLGVKDLKIIVVKVKKKHFLQLV